MTDDAEPVLDSGRVDVAAVIEVNGGPGIDHVSGLILALLIGGGLGLAAGGGSLPLLVAVAVVQGALVLSWVFGTGLPGRVGGIVLGALAAGGADAVVSVWPHDQLGTLLPVLALALPVAFVHQLTRGVVRARVLESLSDIALVVVAVVALAALIQLRHELGGDRIAPTVAFAIGGALVAGHLMDLVLPVPRFDPEVPRGLLAVVAAAVVGALICQLRLGDQVEFVGGRAPFLGAAIGTLAALFAVGSGFVQLATSLPGSGRAVRLRAVFGTGLPLALATPVAYLLCLAIHA
ncbi:MAG TPA: hypothetical protein VK816_01640 [Jatrophihabitantaceae bacterium]|nr:hypothetical protein [Jatrophihabitantaceae bacterium]